MEDIEDEYLIDFSTILSNTSTIAGLNNTTNNRIISKLDDNLEIRSLKPINEQLIEIGFESIFKNEDGLVTLDHDSIKRNFEKFLKNNRCLNQNLINVQNESYQQKREKEFLLIRTSDSKDEKQKAEEKINQLGHRFRQLEEKLNEKDKNIKLMMESNKKLSIQMENREKIFKIEKIKTEKQFASLKDRLNRLTMDSNIQYSGLNICETLKNPLFNLKNQDYKNADLSNKLLNEYESTLNQLLIELNDIKLFLFKTIKSVSLISKIENQIDIIEDCENLLFNHSFEEIYKKLDVYVESIINGFRN